MVSIILTMIILPTLGKDATTIMTMIKVNQILGQVTIMVVTYTIVVICDGVINRKFDNDITGIDR